jgi:hypothetical protein
MNLWFSKNELNEDDSYADDPIESTSNPLTQNISKMLALVLLVVGGGAFIQSTLSASLNLNSGVSVEFGQSVSQTTACSGTRNLSVTPTASFTNATNAGSHYLGSIKVSNIPSSCSGRFFNMSVYPDSESTPNALFGSVTAIPVVDADNVFYLTDQSYSSNVRIASSSASCVGGTAGTCYSFTLTFVSPIMLATNAVKFVLESSITGINGLDCLRVSSRACLLIDAGLSNAVVKAVTWSSIDSSSDGSVIAATGTDGGAAIPAAAGVYVSRDSGLSWIKTTLSNTNWVGTAVSADGNKIVVASYGGQMQRSTNAGATWTLAPVNDYFTGLASSSDGNYLTAVTNRGCVYISSNAGVSWTKVLTTPSKLNTIALSSTGQYQYLTNSGNISGNIYKSSDYGATWTDATPSGTGSNLFYTDITTSSDGSVIAATAGSSGIIISRDSGATWIRATLSPDPGSWSSVATNGDGTRIIASSSGKDLYLSTDSGATWQNQTPIGIGHNLSWNSVSINADGTRFIGLVNNGSIYISNSA